MATSQKTGICVNVRWMFRRDMADVLDIEQNCFEFPWKNDDFLCCLRRRDCIGMVAEHNDRVVGFMIYRLHGSRIHLLNLAVHPLYWRQGVGSQMIAKLIAKLSIQRQNRIALEVRESNVPAQIFFRECGFRATSILRGYYKESPEDAYHMQYRYRQASKLLPK